MLPTNVGRRISTLRLVAIPPNFSECINSNRGDGRFSEVRNVVRLLLSCSYWSNILNLPCFRRVNGRQPPFLNVLFLSFRIIARLNHLRITRAEQQHAVLPPLRFFRSEGTLAHPLVLSCDAVSCVNARALFALSRLCALIAPKLLSCFSELFTL